MASMATVEQALGVKIVYEKQPELEEKSEKKFRNDLAAKIPADELKKFRLRYIPDYIREIKNKRSYWHMERDNWDDRISKKNWQKYNQELKVAVNKQKTILKNLDKFIEMLEPDRGKNFFTESLDPERIEALVTHIKENEGDDDAFYKMMTAPLYNKDYVQFYYCIYAICAKYGEYRARPSQQNIAAIVEKEKLSGPVNSDGEEFFDALSTS